MTIAVDVDGVVADFVGSAIAYLSSIGFSPGRVGDGHIFDWLSAAETGAFIAYSSLPGYAWHSILSTDDSMLEYVRKLSTRHDVFFATVPWPWGKTWCFDRTQWLSSRFPSIPVSFVHDKSVVAADALIDDSVRNLDRFNGRRVLMRSPYNADTAWDGDEWTPSTFLEDI